MINYFQRLKRCLSKFYVSPVIQPRVQSSEWMPLEDELLEDTNIGMDYWTDVFVHFQLFFVRHIHCYDFFNTLFISFHLIYLNDSIKCPGLQLALKFWYMLFIYQKSLLGAFMDVYDSTKPIHKHNSVTTYTQYIQ